MSSTTNPSSEDLLDKIHGLSNTFRRERDDARRSLQLAKERRTLAVDEANSLAKTVQELRDKLATLKDVASQQKENEQYQLQVLELTRKVDFQHSDLIQKRNKGTALQSTVCMAQEQRARDLERLTLTVRHHRHVADTNKDGNKWHVHADASVLSTELSDGKTAADSGDFDGPTEVVDWPTLVHARAADLQAVTTTVRDTCDGYDRAVTAYRMQYNVELAPSHTTMARVNDDDNVTDSPSPTQETIGKTPGVDGTANQEPDSMETNVSTPSVEMDTVVASVAVA